MVSCYSCCNYINNQVKFNETRQISLTVIISGKNGDDCREKNYMSVAYFGGYQILVLFIDFEVLLYTCKLDWILNSSSFFQYLAMALQTSISNFLLPFWFGITKNKNCLFPKALQVEVGQLDVNFREISSDPGDKDNLRSSVILFQIFLNNFTLESAFLFHVIVLHLILAINLWGSTEKFLK